MTRGKSSCRDNPLPPDTRSTDVRGLAPIEKTPPNTLIAFSADSGQLANVVLSTAPAESLIEPVRDTRPPTLIVKPVVVAGHGVQNRGTYYFIPHDASPDQPELSGIGQDSLTRELRGNLGGSKKAIVMLDTCRSSVSLTRSGGPRSRSAGTNTDSLVEELSKATGLIIMSAADGSDVALKDEKWGHGAFTLAVHRGLSGEKADKTDRNGDGAISSRHGLLWRRSSPAAPHRGIPRRRLPAAPREVPGETASSISSPSWNGTPPRIAYPRPKAWWRYRRRCGRQSRGRSLHPRDPVQAT